MVFTTSGKSFLTEDALFFQQFSILSFTKAEVALGACHTLPVRVIREKADDCRKARMPNADQLSHHSGSENIKMKADRTVVLLCEGGDNM